MLLGLTHRLFLIMSYNVATPILFILCFTYSDVFLLITLISACFSGTLLLFKSRRSGLDNLDLIKTHSKEKEMQKGKTVV